MREEYFLSYSDDNGKDLETWQFVAKLRNALSDGSPSFKTWLFKVDDDGSREWDSQAEEVIRDGSGLILVLSQASVRHTSACKNEWTEAVRFKKPIFLVQWERGINPPMLLNGRNRRKADFTGDFDAGLAKLRGLLTESKSPRGELQTLRERLGGASQALASCTDAHLQKRLQHELVDLKSRIDASERAAADPQGTAQRNRARVELEIGQERQRRPGVPHQHVDPAAAGVPDDRIVNRTPAETPQHYQDRLPEAALVGRFLADDSKRLLVVWGRGGIGKTAVVCRVLNHLRRHGQLPDGAGPLALDGIVFLDARMMQGVAWPSLHADLCRLLPPTRADELRAVLPDDQLSLLAKVQHLTAAFASGRTVVLIDNFEDLLDRPSGALKESDFDAALRAVLNGPQHGLKLIITSQVVPRDLAQFQPSRQALLPLDKGLESPFAEDLLRAMDEQGHFGLKTAPAALLTRARDATRGNPKALEVLFAALASDWNTSLAEIVERAEQALHGRALTAANDDVLPESVMHVLVGEAFSRLDDASRQVMQALAVFNRPVSPVAVDYLLLPYINGISAAPVLRQLVNWHFVRKDGPRYDLHSIERAYVFARLPRGAAADRQPHTQAQPAFSQMALLHRAADYFRRSCPPKSAWLDRQDLDHRVAEFELRCDCEDFDEAARVLLEIDHDYLSPWGMDLEVVQMHERLEGRLTDLQLQLASATRLSKACVEISRYDDALRSLDKALVLARTLGMHIAEADLLSSIGLCHFRLGDFLLSISLGEKALSVLGETRTLEEDRIWLEASHVIGFSHSAIGNIPLAVLHTEQALQAALRLRDYGQECRQRGFLGLYASYLGDAQRALAFDLAALRQAQQLKRPRDVVCLLGFLAEVCCTQLGDHDASVRHAEEALRIVAEICSPLNGSWCNQWLAVSRGLKGDLPGARQAAEEACRFDEPLNNQTSFAVLGVVALRQGDVEAARKAFDAAVDLADRVLARCDRNWEALDAKGLALSGLALLTGRNGLNAAVATFEAARQATSDAGLVRRILRQLDLLAPADTEALLERVRRAAGELAA